MKLKRLRLKIGFTQKECADFLNISLRNYNKYENRIEKINEYKYTLYCEKLKY